MTVFVLVLAFGYGLDGKALDSRLEFSNLPACEAAKKLVDKELTGVRSVCLPSVRVRGSSGDQP